LPDSSQIGLGSGAERLPPGSQPVGQDKYRVPAQALAQVWPGGGKTIEALQGDRRNHALGDRWVMKLAVRDRATASLVADWGIAIF
jgi:hypothetical protein